MVSFIRRDGEDHAVLVEPRATLILNALQIAGQSMDKTM